MEHWAEIPGFPDYSVSNQGRVVNENTGRFMSLARNQQGYRIVFLRQSGQQYTRSVTTLVADAFVPRDPERPHFDSVIHLDGDKSNLRYTNLERRPRWFVIKYHKQFEYFRFHHKLHPYGIEVPVIDLSTGEIFDNTTFAAIKYGLLEIDLVKAVHNHTGTFPYGREFALASV
jgi:hypothetical protein